MNHGTNINKLERLIERIINKTSGKLTITPVDVHLLMKHAQEIEPFHNVNVLRAKSYQEEPSWEDLRFLELFPNIRELSIRDEKCCSQAEAKRMTFDGIQNCFSLKKVRTDYIMLPPILSGIEYCTELVSFELRVFYESDFPMDITPLTNLPLLKKISTYNSNIHRRVRVETEGLDLSGCKSLEELFIRPTSKDFQFLGSVQLKILGASHSGIESLEGLNITKLRIVHLGYNQIACLEKLRGIPRGTRWHLADNPIDPEVLKEIIRTWV